jgi:DNA-binding transcriptional regulator YdaS (Cro superfamily)
MSSEALREAIRIAGSQTKLARAIDVTQGHVSQWLRRGKVPAEKVLLIERATGIARHLLRPDVFEAAQ